MVIDTLKRVAIGLAIVAAFNAVLTVLALTGISWLGGMVTDENGTHHGLPAFLAYIFFACFLVPGFVAQHYLGKASKPSALAFPIVLCFLILAGAWTQNSVVRIVDTLVLPYMVYNPSMHSVWLPLFICLLVGPIAYWGGTDTLEPSGRKTKVDPTEEAAEFGGEIGEAVGEHTRHHGGGGGDLAHDHISGLFH